MGDPRKHVSIIDKNTSASGTLKTVENVCIYGSLEGEVISQGCTTVAQSGRITGSLKSKEADIEGWVQGSIEAGERIVISATSVIESEIVSPRLIVHPGGRIKGYFIISPNEEERKRLQNERISSNSAPVLKKVPFAVSIPNARNVRLVGSFCDWDESRSLEFEPGSNGKWTCEVKLMPGTYEYLIIVDGQPQLDSSNPNKVANSYGGENSVLKVS